MSVEQLRADGWVREGHRWVSPRLKAEAATVDTDIPNFWDVLEGNLAIVTAGQHLSTTPQTCRDCRCLIHPDETCPSCRWTLIRWCELEDVRHSWAPIPYTPTPVEEVAAA